MRLWKSWDEEEKASALRIMGLAVCALTVFVAVAIISYLFSWKEDLSLLHSATETASDAANKAGSLGFRTGHLLVCELFGLGSLSFLLILGAVSIRLLSHRWKRSLVKTALIALFGAFISSLLLAFAGKLAGLDYVFGGGLGGRCGARVIEWSESLMGVPVTGFLVVILIAMFLFFSSRRFNHWFASIGTAPRKKKEKKAKAEVSPTEELSKENTNKESEPTITEEETEAATPESKNTDTEEVTPVLVSDTPKAGESNSATLENNSLASPEKAAPAPTTATEESGEGSFEIIEDEDGLSTEVTEQLQPIDNRLDPPDGLPNYVFPSLDLLESHSKARKEVSTDELTRNNNKIRVTLSNYRIQVTEVKAIVGPTITLYKVYPAPGVKISEIIRLQDDIGMSLNARGVRVFKLADSVGIEVANDNPSIVPLLALLNDEAFRTSTAALPVAIGYTVTQKVRVFDLASAPHLLIAGATQQGKSVGLNVIISSLLYSKHPSELKFVFIDPKMVEFTSYSNLIRHYLAVLPDALSEEDEKAEAILTKASKAEKVLRSLCIEMDERYELLRKAGVNKISLYNDKYKARRLRPDHGHRFLPYIVVVVDEYNDLTMTTGVSPTEKAASRSITNSIIRLAQKGRAAGLHVILATQRPSVDVISGVIKSNFPMRIAFKTSSRVDSQTILDAPGAEKLVGKGDMLLFDGVETDRIQCGFVSGTEIDAITEFIGAQMGYGKCYNTPYYLPSVADAGSSDKGSGEGGSLGSGSYDEKFEEAARMVVSTQKGSTSDLQRKLGMGYAKAGRVMDQLESAGIVGPQEGSRPRQVLVSDLESLQEILDKLK